MFSHLLNAPHRRTMRAPLDIPELGIRHGDRLTYDRELDAVAVARVIDAQPLREYMARRRRSDSPVLELMR